MKCVNEKYEQFSEKTLADFNDVQDGDIYKRAEEFWKYMGYIKEQKHYNYRRISLTGSGTIMVVRDIKTGKNKKMLSLASNDYLNLTKHTKVVKAGIQAVEKYGTGAGSVPLLGGTIDLHVELEQKIAAFKGCEDAIIYTSGFGSNCSSILSLLGGQDLAILDTLAHASLAEGCMNTNVKRFRHNDPVSLERVLKKYSKRYRTVFVIIDGVYSMDGDIAKLDRIVEVTHSYKAYVMVDEAHATGVIGESGKGTPNYFDMEGTVDIVSGTFSKALGCVGGFIAASKELINLLRFYSKGYMFSTAMTPQATASLIAAIDVIENEPKIRYRLWKNINYFRTKLLQNNFDIGLSQTSIFPIIIGDDRKVKEVAKLLHEQDIYVNPVLFPAVSKNQARIRMTVTANHTFDQLDLAVKVLLKIDNKLNIKKSLTKY